MIVTVLYIHSYFIEAEEFALSDSLQRVTGTHGIARVAVPMFFCLSGLMFFRNVKKSSECIAQIRKRVKTLAVPYVLWNIIFVAWYVILQSIPSLGKYINSDIINMIIGSGFMGGMKALLWDPVGFHLWFLRDLIFMVAFSPVIYLACKHLSWFAPILSIFYSIWVNCNGLVFFSLGACVALHSSLEDISKKVQGGIGIICGIIFVANAVWQLSEPTPMPLLDSVIDCCGIVSVWYVYDIIASIHLASTKRVSVNPLLSYTFFIYLFHEPTLNIFKKIGVRILGAHDWSLTILYLICPLIMCIMSVVIAKLLQKCSSKTYNILVGGR